MLLYVPVISDTHYIDNVIYAAHVIIQNSNDLPDVTTTTQLSGDMYDPNHHSNNFRNPILFADWHVSTTDMRQTLASSNYLWLLIKP